MPKSRNRNRKEIRRVHNKKRIKAEKVISVDIETTTDLEAKIAAIKAKYA